GCTAWCPSVCAGRTDRAHGLIDEFSAQADAAGWAWSAARAAHLRAVLDPSENAFEAALGLHEQAGRPFPRARTPLADGEWLRRAGRRIDSRTQLRPSLVDPGATRRRALGRAGARRATSDRRTGTTAHDDRAGRAHIT